MTDEDLRRELEAGARAPTIAAKYGVSRQAIYKRIKNLQIGTVAAVVAPAEARRFAGAQIDAIEELTRVLHRARRLGDACDEWLRDPVSPDRYTLEPRANEIKVIYRERIGLNAEGIPIFARKRAPLAALVAMVEEDDAGGQAVRIVDGYEAKTADPRELTLKTVAEVRQIVGLAAQLARMLADARAMEAFRSAMLAAIAQVSPEVANEIADAVRRSILLHNAAGAIESVADRRVGDAPPGL